jgi:beta-aspartyl-peptidase (threonine type)
MSRRILLLGLSLFALSAAAQTGPSSQPQTAIRALLQTQVDAWNRHDLEAFMTGYWHSPELTFFSGGTETKGWEPTLERYRQHYQANGAPWAR